MAHVEVGVALARKAFSLTKGNDGQAEKIKAMARVFAGEVARVVGENALKIVMGTAAVDQAGVDQFLAQIGYMQMLGSRLNWVADMDKIADIIFER
jgi:alkylation response protein AidB-like acyl-CoA dehydrogenase